MKNNLTIVEFVFSLIIIVLLFFFINPFNLLMPPPYLTMLTVLLILIFGGFAVAVWREKARDEREGLHRMLAARFAFLSGAAFLVLSIIIQSLNHRLDPFLVYTLGVMILAKIIGQIYGKMKF
jgi:hypothetical protein